MARGLFIEALDNSRRPRHASLRLSFNSARFSLAQHSLNELRTAPKKMHNQNRQRGFSLIELLIVVTIIGIIASIAIPNLLASRRAAFEGSAIGSLRTLHSANAAYQVTNGGGEYAADLTALNTASMIDAQMATGKKSGYLFAITRTLSTSIALATFSATSNPANTTGVLQTGTRRFGTTQVGVVYYDVTQGATLANVLTPLEMVGAGSGAIKVLGN